MHPLSFHSIPLSSPPFNPPNSLRSQSFPLSILSSFLTHPRQFSRIFFTVFQESHRLPRFPQQVSPSPFTIQEIECENTNNEQCISIPSIVEVLHDSDKRVRIGVFLSDLLSSHPLFQSLLSFLAYLEFLRNEKAFPSLYCINVFFVK